MKQPLIEHPDPPLVSKMLHTITGNITEPWVRWLQGMKKAHPFFPTDTSGGPVTIALPVGSVYLNREHLYLKSTSDGNAITITGAVGGPVTISSHLQKARFRFDGKSWYDVT